MFELVKISMANMLMPTAACRSEQSPDGYCVMAVAENRQTVDFLQVG